MTDQILEEQVIKPFEEFEESQFIEDSQFIEEDSLIDNSSKKNKTTKLISLIPINVEITNDKEEIQDPKTKAKFIRRKPDIVDIDFTKAGEYTLQISSPENLIKFLQGELQSSDIGISMKIVSGNIQQLADEFVENFKNKQINPLITVLRKLKKYENKETLDYIFEEILEKIKI